MKGILLVVRWSNRVAASNGRSISAKEIDSFDASIEGPIFSIAKSRGTVYDSFMKRTVLFTNCVHRSLGRSALLVVSLLIGCFAFSPQAGAVCQQGCDPTNNNTFLGDDALLSNTTGLENTAEGFQASLVKNQF